MLTVSSCIAIVLVILAFRRTNVDWSEVIRNEKEKRYNKGLYD